MFTFAALLAGTAPQPGLVYTRQAQGAPNRLIVLRPDGTTAVLSTGFVEAADPEVSWDGKQILFAARKTAAAHWQIYEMPATGGAARQVVSAPFDCRSPVYQSEVYVITADRPWRQIAFVANSALYSARLDGSDLRRLTWHADPDSSPQMLPDGRMVFSSRGGLYGVNADGTDFAEFSTHEGPVEKQTPTVTRDLVVFTEPSALGAVSLRRNLHSYRSVAAGQFRTPSALPDGEILVSRKTGASRYSLWRLNPESGALEQVHADPAADILQARAILPRPEPDGRSSVVDLSKPTGKLYCLSAHTTDSPNPAWSSLVKRLRVLDAAGKTLGELELEPDGSFQADVPANMPLTLQLLDDRSAPLRACRQIWVRNNENRGCIGCHEDGELTPENRLTDALNKPAVHIGGQP